MNEAEQLGVQMENGMLLPEDALIEVLVYLPVKSLLRFRRVSKNWCILIKSSTFVTRHLKHDREEIMLLKRYLPSQNSEEICQDGEDVFSFHNPYSPDLLIMPNLVIPYFNDIVGHEYVRLFGPCNGLVCLIFKDINILCNPAMREFKKLPPVQFSCPKGYVSRILGSGFGIDANTNSYKLVQISNIEQNENNYIDESEYFFCYQEDNSYIKVDLYNSSTSSWKQIDAKVPAILQNPGFDLFFHGACHWAALLFKDGPLQSKDGPLPMGIILSFNVSTEVFQQFGYPNDDGKHPSLVAINECLSVVRYMTWIVEQHLIDIWVMKEYGNDESWIKQWVIGPYLFRRPLLSRKDELLLVETIDATLASYAVNANEIKRFQFDGLKCSFRALFFKESLISFSL